MELTRVNNVEELKQNFNNNNQLMIDGLLYLSNNDFKPYIIKIKNIMNPWDETKTDQRIFDGIIFEYKSITVQIQVNTKGGEIPNVAGKKLSFFMYENTHFNGTYFGDRASIKNIIKSIDTLIKNKKIKNNISPIDTVLNNIFLGENAMTRAFEIYTLK